VNPDAVFGKANRRILLVFLSGWPLQELGEQFGEELDGALFALGIEHEEDGWEEGKRLAASGVADSWARLWPEWSVAG
jgi:hypothetical protein